MNHRWAAGACLLATVWLGGCAVEGASFQRKPVSDQSVVYVYRPYNYAGSLLHPPVTCNGQSAEIGPGAYHPFVIDPGKVVCRVETTATDEVELTTEAGRSYYIRESFGWGAWLGHPHLDPQDTDAAQGEIQSCCKLPPADAQAAP